MIEPATSLLADLYRLTDRLSAARGLENVLDEVLSAAMALTNSDMGNIALYSTRTGSFTMPLYKGFSRAYVEYMLTSQKRPAPGGPREQALDTLRRVIIPSVVEDSAFTPFRYWVEEAGFVAMQATPIVSRHGEPVGTICTFHRQHQVLSEDRLNLLDIYGRLAADAIERENVETSLRESEERFRRLHSLTVQLVGMDDWRQSLHEVLISTMSLVGADAGSLKLYDSDDCPPSFVVNEGLDDEFLRHFAALPPELDASPSRDASRRRQPVVIEDVMTHPVFQPHLDVMRPRPLRSCVAIPLMTLAGNSIGGICLFFHDRRVLEPEQLQILELYGRLATETTERLVHEAEMARTTQALRDALNTKDQFLGMVSHELRTPMTIIRGLSSVLRRNPELAKPALAEIYQDLGDASGRLYQLIENMLILARLEVGRRPSPELLLVDKLLATVADQLQSEMPDLKLTLRHPPSGVIVLGIGQSLQQVIRNLVENAHKYSNPGTPVEIEAEVHEDAVRVSVLDRGIGLKNPEEIFEPFCRESTAEQVAPGLGLGLAVCKMLLDAQGGAIWAEPRPGGGSIFNFTLQRPSEEAFVDLAI